MVTSWLKEILMFTSDRALSFLLAFLFTLLFVLYPFFPPEGLGKYLIDVFLSLVLISGTFAVETSTILEIIFFSFASVVILGRVFAAGAVMRHRVEGAVAVYLSSGD